MAAKALSHLTVKWPWLADQLPPHTHLLRLSYGRLGEADPDVTVEGALRDIRTLTGVDELCHLDGWEHEDGHDRDLAEA